MQIISYLLFALAAVGVAYSTAMLLYQRKFNKQSQITVGTVVDQEFDKKRKGVHPVVQFRANKRVIHAKAIVFDKTPITLGQKVNLRFLNNGPDAKKWDVRIIGKTAGYGKKRTMKFTVIGYCISASVLAAGIAILFVF